MKINWSITEAEQAFLSKIAKAENDRIEYLLRTKVSPPIVGEITESKVRWRGLCIANLSDGKKVLMQRGRQVGIISELYIVTNLMQ